MMNKKFAMTFSEVLVALVIIGVVAILTVPVLKKHTQKQEYITKLKKVVVVLEEMIDLATDEKGPMYKWTMSSDTKIDDFEKYLILAYKCEGTHSDDCFGDSYRTLDGSGATPEKSGAVMLLDGSAISISDCNGTTCDVHVDINGKEKPNIFGVDYFTLQLDKDKEKVVPKDCEADDCMAKEIIETGWQMNYW